MAIDHTHDARVGGVSIRSLPKVSLHDHLDGAVRPETIVELAPDAGVELPAPDAKKLRRWIAEQSNTDSLESYLETFDLTVGVMQTADALRRIAREFVEDAVDDGIIYAEVRWAPEQHTQNGLSMEEAIEAVAEGIADGEAAAEDAGKDIRVNQILSAMRQNKNSLRVAELAVEYRDRGVVAFDIAGPEEGFMPEDHREAFDFLADEFFPVTVHAGEGSGLSSIASALIDGRALRLGHGVRLAEDIETVEAEADEVRVRLGNLAQWVRDREIALELSPTSNLHTGASEAFGDALVDHPFDQLYQLGFNVTVNVDNRTMSSTSLTKELAQLVEAFGYDLDDLEAFQLNAAAASFLPVEEREELVEIIAEGFSD